LKSGSLSEYFSGIAFKLLSEVEANPNSSNQRELNGVKALQQLFPGNEERKIAATVMWLGEDEVVSSDSELTWYDARRKHPTRSEFRLYFQPNDAMSKARAGDALLVAKKKRGGVLVIVANPETTAYRQVAWLFGLRTQMSTSLGVERIRGTRDTRLDFVARSVLEHLGVDVRPVEGDLLQQMVRRFGNSFPSSREFSAWARCCATQISVLDDPDEALMVWLDSELMLFKIFERHLVSSRLERGFAPGGRADVEEFIRYSLGVQNRRKARAGLALENHLEEIFRQMQVPFERGVVTERNNCPDFLFPGAVAYHDPTFPSDKLVMLAAKASCKDRWRQVLNEAARIPMKHLLTLEPGISIAQTNDMEASGVKLVLPRSIQPTYVPEQVVNFLTLGRFLSQMRPSRAIDPAAKFPR
jgi:hypothetical protein